MKIAHLVFHPDLNASRVNKAWSSLISESGKVSSTRDLYAEYPDFRIDVAREQAELLAHDRIVFQFPFYWYSTPPLMRKWLDDPERSDPWSFQRKAIARSTRLPGADTL